MTEDGSTRMNNIDTRLNNIDSRLTNIEKGLTATQSKANNSDLLSQMKQQVDKIEKRGNISRLQWGIGFSLVAMIFAHNLLTDSTPDNNIYGIIIAVLGILLLIWSTWSPIFFSKH